MDAPHKNQPLKAMAVKGVAVITAQNVMLLGIWFLTSLALLNAISVADYGVLKLVFAVVAVPSALYIAGLDPIIQADMGVERERGRLGVLKSLFRAYVLFEIISAVVIWLGFVLCISFFKDSFNEATQAYLFLASFTIFARPLQNILIQFFSLYFRFRQVTMVKLIDELATLAATLYFVWYLQQGLYAAIVIQAVVPFVSVVFCLPAFVALYRKQLRGIQFEPAGFFARIRAHAKWSIAAAYVLKASDSLHLFFIDRFVGREAVALFSLADALWGYMTSLFPIKTVLDAMVPQRAQEEAVARQNLVRGTKYTFLGYAMLGALCAICGYPFLSLFYPKYVKAFPVFLGLLLMIPRVSFSTALGPLLRAYKFQRPGFTAAVVSLVLTVIFAYMLYPTFGMVGVIAEVVLTNTILVYIVYKIFIKRYPAFRLRLGELFTWDTYDADTVGILVRAVRARFKLSSRA